MCLKHLSVKKTVEWERGRWATDGKTGEAKKEKKLQTTFLVFALSFLFHCKDWAILGHKAFTTSLRMQALSLFGPKQYLPAYQTWGERWGTVFTFISHKSQDEDARAIDHRETLWTFPLMPSPEGSLQICPISNEGEGELSLMGRVGSDGLWFVPIDSQPFHLLPGECVRGLCSSEHWPDQGV